MTPVFNLRARHIDQRNSTSGATGVHSNRSDETYSVSSPNEEDKRIRIRYGSKYLAVNHRRYLEEMYFLRAHLSVNHLMLEVLHSDSFLLLFAKEFFRSHIIHHDFDCIDWSSTRGDNYDADDVEHGNHIDIVDGVIYDLRTNLIRRRPTLIRDLMVHQVKISDIGTWHGHLFQAMHEALIQKRELCPSMTIQAFIFEHWKFAQGHRKSTKTKNRVSIEERCKDDNFQTYLGLNELPRLEDGSIDLASLPLSEHNTGMYELLTASAWKNVTVVIWERIVHESESSDEFDVFRYSTGYDAREGEYSRTLVHIAYDGNPRKWSVLQIEPYQANY
ncbi:hypothetical protein THAOC_31399 [Thalassiosira oceanica]|uniref:Uncharacterized protein n=1 Tax=Thalassiosira oceanica TaxID=159749 RepID=K0RLG7_THAOC|nr:hypothetical protein THAOC_31399 [Thalassiosira oceanica]|eukprot:EJK49696.1 hypothetical protein THAOC_31399 [Thalassiosira oceanica]